MRMTLPAGVRISISFNPLGVAGVLFCFRPVVPANERTGTQYPCMAGFYDSKSRYAAKQSSGKTAQG